MNARSLDPQAQQLNDTIQKENPSVYQLLSKRGKSIFFPKLGILSQSADAKGKDINATIGIAKEDDGKPMFLPSTAKGLDLPAGKVYPYAPSPGAPDVRQLWKDMQISKNPGLKGKAYSQPVVTNALTHALGIAGFLFVGEDDSLILPDFYWENYDLTFSIAYGCALDTYKTFTPDGKYNVEGLREKLSGPVGKKVVVLNFPNNPTGYTPLEDEVTAIVSVLKEAAEAGNQITVLLDDAYFGLVFEEGVYKESLFSELCDLHENILAIKVDGPTKEDYVWGFRVGFVSFGIKGGSEALYKALEAKAGGAIRGTISNVSHMAQSLLTQAWSSETYAQEKQEKYDTLRGRYNLIKDILKDHPEYEDVFTPLPFNSGYFMCIELKKGESENVRQMLLEKYSTGVIAFNLSSSSLIRLAFSSTPTQQLEQLFQNVYEAAKSA